MDKENNNVVGRLGSKYNNEPGDKIMCSMPKEAGSNESGAFDSEGKTEELLPHHAAAIATLGAAFFGTIIISLIVSRMWDEDDIKLHILNAVTHLLQNIAFNTGKWALQCERAYNDYVNALH